MGQTVSDASRRRPRFWLLPASIFRLTILASLACHHIVENASDSKLIERG
jgi:hypothetical protein